nr:MAG TPA: hypothetical protein [Caudoviricetes sp.]
MNTTAVTLNDINLAVQDLASNGGFLKFDKDSYNRLCVIDMRVNAELFETHRVLGRRYDELDAVDSALDSVTEEDVEAKAFYETRKAQLVVLTNELSDKLEEIKDNMKTQYAELTEEEFQVFAKAVEWNSKNGKERTGFSKR